MTLSPKRLLDEIKVELRAEAPLSTLLSARASHPLLDFPFSYLLLYAVDADVFVRYLELAGKSGSAEPPAAPTSRGPQP